MSAGNVMSRKRGLAFSARLLAGTLAIALPGTASAQAKYPSRTVKFAFVHEITGASGRPRRACPDGSCRLAAGKDLIATSPKSL